MSVYYTQFSHATSQNTRREWSRAIQQETRQLLTAKRPQCLPRDAQHLVLYFKSIYGTTAVMTADDYMNRRCRLTVMPNNRVRVYESVEALLADGWVVR